MEDEGMEAVKVQEASDLEKELDAAEHGGVDLAVSNEDLLAVLGRVRAGFVGQFHFLKEGALANRACGEEEGAQKAFSEARKVLKGIQHVDARIAQLKGVK